MRQNCLEYDLIIDKNENLNDKDCSFWGDKFHRLYLIYWKYNWTDRTQHSGKVATAAATEPVCFGLNFKSNNKNYETNV